MPNVRRRRLNFHLNQGGDGLISFSQRTHAYLKEKNVPHLWHLDSGGHDFTVWRNDLYHFAQRIFQ